MEESDKGERKKTEWDVIKRSKRKREERGRKSFEKEKVSETMGKERKKDELEKSVKKKRERLLYTEYKRKIIQNRVTTKLFILQNV